jgi:LPS export ABC transporter protein LptC
MLYNYKKSGVENVLSDKTTIKKYRTVLILCVVIFLLYLYSGCSGSRNVQSDQTKNGDPSIQSRESDTSSNTEKNGEKSENGKNGEVELKKSQLQSRDGNRKIWSLQANKVNYDETGMTARAEEIIVEFFTEDEQLALSLKALGAVADLKEQSLKFEGKVTAKTPTGDELVVSELKWDGLTKKLLGDKFVRIVRNDVIMTAHSMIADPDLKQIELSGEVKMVYPDMQNFLNF